MADIKSTLAELNKLTPIQLVHHLLKLKGKRSAARRTLAMTQLRAAMTRLRCTAAPTMNDVSEVSFAEIEAMLVRVATTFELLDGRCAKAKEVNGAKISKLRHKIAAIEQKLMLSKLCAAVKDSEVRSTHELIVQNCKTQIGQIKQKMARLRVKSKTTIPDAFAESKSQFLGVEMMRVALPPKGQFDERPKDDADEEAVEAVEPRGQLSPSTIATVLGMVRDRHAAEGDEPSLYAAFFDPLVRGPARRRGADGAHLSMFEFVNPRAMPGYRRRFGDDAEPKFKLMDTSAAGNYAAAAAAAAAADGEM